MNEDPEGQGRRPWSASRHRSTGHDKSTGDGRTAVAMASSKARMAVGFVCAVLACTLGVVLMHGSQASATGRSVVEATATSGTCTATLTPNGPLATATAVSATVSAGCNTGDYWLTS